MIVQAIATLVLDPVEKSILSIRAPKVYFSPTSIKHLTTRTYEAISGLDIAASTTPRSFSHDTPEAYVLAIDSGTAPAHLLTLILFPLGVRRGVQAEMAAWRAARQLDEIRGGAHWYSAAVLKRFCDGFEYYVDQHGQACGVALEGWVESGIEAVFNRAQRSRLGMRRRARCLIDPPQHAEEADRSQEQQQQQQHFHEKSRDSVSDTEMDGGGGGGGWMGEGTLERSLGAVIRSVPSVRGIFQSGPSHAL